MAYFPALASAIFYGAADFLGGMAARRAPTSAVVIISGAAGVALLGVLLPFMPATFSNRDLVWGAVAGVAGGAGVGFLYRALAIGRMAVVAPTTALCAVAIPVVAGLLLGERPSRETLSGIALAFIAIVLVSQPSQGSSGGGAETSSRYPRGIGLAFVSGVAIGIFYLTLAQTSPEAGLWPLVAARGASILMFGIIAAVGRHPIAMSAPALAVVIAAGVIDMTANALYVLATHRGSLSVVVTLASLYPASTVILARVVLKERLSRLQIAGVICALAAVMLIVGGE